MNKPAPRALLVVGMHRSGTSALAGALRHTGVDFGKDLMPANQTEENPKGFFEDLVIVRLHDLILGALNSRWDDPRQMTLHWEDVEEVAPHRLALKNRILEMFGDSPVWGIKDPRLCVLYPLWQSILEEIGHEPILVPVMRNPMEVARSLQRRNSFSLEKGYHLWMRYLRGMNSIPEEHAVSVVEYSRLLEDPVGVIHGVFQEAKITGEAWGRSAIACALGDFISPDLRHEVSDRTSCGEDSLLSVALETYQRMSAKGLGVEIPACPVPSPDLMLEHLNQLQSDHALIHEKMIMFGEKFQQLRREKTLTEPAVPKPAQAIPVQVKPEDLAFEKDRGENYYQHALYFNHLYLIEKGQNLLLQRECAKLQWSMFQMEDSLLWRWNWFFRYVGGKIMVFLGGASVSRIRWVAKLVRTLPLRLRAGVNSPLLEGSVCLPVPAEHPVISIVIPVYGHMDETLRCLESLARMKTDVPFELVVVDDQSPDATRAALALVPHIVLIKNRHNLGFVGSCNVGAARARGAYLLFLNSDTEVKDSCLERLLEVFERKKNAGVVGAKLIYPNGLLQECGGLIWKDGNGNNYGNGQYPDSLEYQYLREADYVSGACLMTPADLFRQMEGFDEMFAPGYYEDVDYAFRVRDSGKKVYVQPRCEIIHFEGLSAGKETSGAGMKRFQESNRSTFVERWNSVLQDQPNQEEFLPEMAMRHRCSHSVLFVDSMMISPQRDAGSYRAVQLLNLLAEEGCHVTFASLNLGFVDEDVSALQDSGIRVLHHPEEFSLKTYLEAQGSQYDIIILSRLETVEAISPWVRKCCPDTCLIFDTVDLHFLREQRAAKLFQSEEKDAAALETKKREIQSMVASDMTLVVSPAEKNLLASEAPEIDVQVLPTIFNCDPTPDGFEKREGILFIGSFAHPPNVDAVLFLVREILPLLRERLAGIPVVIIGANPPSELLEWVDDDIEVTGWVEDVRPYFEQCRLSIAPLRFGAGVKGKINMSLCWGVPVVGTTLGCEGMHLIHKESAMIADTPEAIVDSILELYTRESRWNTLRENGLRVMEERFSTEAARPVIQHLLRKGSE